MEAPFEREWHILVAAAFVCVDTCGVGLCLCGSGHVCLHKCKLEADGCSVSSFHSLPNF